MLTTTRAAFSIAHRFNNLKKCNYIENTGFGPLFKSYVNPEELETPTDWKYDSEKQCFFCINDNTRFFPVQVFLNAYKVS